MGVEDVASLDDAAGWDELAVFLSCNDDAWCWGYCDAALRWRMGRLFMRIVNGTAEPTDVDQLLMAWQVLRAFPVEYPFLATA